MPARPAPRSPWRTLALVLVALVAVAACSDGGGDGEPAADTAADDEPAPGAEAAAAALEEGRTVIDVRTPEEYAAGHVVDAELVNVQDPAFDERIAELDPEVGYVVYCRSGNRSATAATRMRAEGLDVLDGGALTDMEEAGWPVEA